MEEEKLTNKVDKLIKTLEENKGKEFKLPFRLWFGAKGKARKNFCLALIVRTNGETVLKWLPIEEDTIPFNEQIYSATANYILRYKKYPMIIIAEWNSEPFSPVENYEDAERNKTLVAGQKYIMTKMKLEAIKPKMNFNFKTILIILGVLGVGYFVLSKLGLF